MILWMIRNWGPACQRWKTGLLVLPQCFLCHMWKQLPSQPTPSLQGLVVSKCLCYKTTVINTRLFPGVFLCSLLRKIWPWPSHSICVFPVRGGALWCRKRTQRKRTSIYWLRLEVTEGILKNKTWEWLQHMKAVNGTKNWRCLESSGDSKNHDA